ncbi:hypothetical protein [Microcoleus sp. D2_18a_D3]|uniref:hypothetical protein n=1 Tax=Microcoleus sp. D2_18a_D3 TaxID=3055330 RepID=UPI002FCF73AA
MVSGVLDFNRRKKEEGRRKKKKCSHSPTLPLSLSPPLPLSHSPSQVSRQEEVRSPQSRLN